MKQGGGSGQDDGGAAKTREAKTGAARILVVEDEAHLADGLRYTLKAEGYEVELAYDGESALALLMPEGAQAQREEAPAAKSPQEPEHGVAGIAHRLGQRLGTRIAPFIENRIGARSQHAQTDGDEVSRESAHDRESSATATKTGGAAHFDAMILDVMLPGKSGFEVVSALRAAAIYVPVLMLTARGRPEDVLHGLEAGADDYLPKPFDLSILLARLHVLLRRMRWYGAIPEKSEERPASFSFAERTIDFSNLELSAKGLVVRLTLMEAEFLRHLVDNPERIITRKELLEQVWRLHEDTDTRAIDNFVVRLRRYIEDEPANPVYLKTVRGLGYRFVPGGE